MPCHAMQAVVALHAEFEYQFRNHERLKGRAIFLAHNKPPHAASTIAPLPDPPPSRHMRRWWSGGDGSSRLGLAW